MELIRLNSKKTKSIGFQIRWSTMMRHSGFVWFFCNFQPFCRLISSKLPSEFYYYFHRKKKQIEKEEETEEKWKDEMKMRCFFVLNETNSPTQNIFYLRRRRVKWERAASAHWTHDDTKVYSESKETARGAASDSWNTKILFFSLRFYYIKLLHGFVVSSQPTSYWYCVLSFPPSPPHFSSVSFSLHSFASV